MDIFHTDTMLHKIKMVLFKTFIVFPKLTLNKSVP